MDAVEMLKEKVRLTKQCDIYCTSCRLGPSWNGKDVNCTELQQEHPEQYVKIVEGWSKDCPKQTYLNKLLEVFPGTELGKDGTPAYICPGDLGLKDIAECSLIECIKCWDQTI